MSGYRTFPNSGYAISHARKWSTFCSTVSTILKSQQMLTTYIRFMSWCTPWGPLSWTQRSEQSPIFAPQKDGWITTPSPNGTPPPETPTSPQQLPLSLMSAVQRKIATDRARLFVAGDYNSLLQSMNKVERQYANPKV